VLTRDHTALPATHTFIHKWNDAFWLVLISVPLTVGSAELAWWLGEMLRWFARLKRVTHPITSRGGRESQSQPSSGQSNALTTRVLSHLANQ